MADDILTNGRKQRQAPRCGGRPFRRLRAFVGFAVRDALEGWQMLVRWADVLVTALLLLTLPRSTGAPHRCDPGPG
ncbi:MAG TPA: hypothetical protein VHH52_05685 [Pseudonocardiaceae bacterium]|jgi:hypothetical protein|nr:hypothetical protein [Pseudonocardiaceae bacterium]